MTIIATQVLSMLNKANRLGASYEIKEYNDGFDVRIHYNWEPNEYYHYSVFITEDSESSSWTKGYFTFDVMMEILDEKLKEQEDKEIKAKKRKALIDSFTPEQRELLGL